MNDDLASSAYRTRFSPDQVTPDALSLKRAEQELRVTWRDGRESVYPASKLRKGCPCATCREDRGKQSRELLPILKQDPSTAVTLADVRLVGTYAVQFFWSDGHDAGIFDYRYLRALGESDIA